jgi:hypothetical protein
MMYLCDILMNILTYMHRYAQGQTHEQQDQTDESKARAVNELILKVHNYALTLTYVHTNTHQQTKAKLWRSTT